MFTDPSPIAILASAFLAGIALSILAFLTPDFVQAIRDLRRPGPLLSDDRTARAVERAISRRIYPTLAILGVVAIVIALFAFSI